MKKQALNGAAGLAGLDRGFSVERSRGSSRAAWWRMVEAGFSFKGNRTARMKEEEKNL